MLTKYSLGAGSKLQLSPQGARVIWLDVVNPTIDEREAIYKEFGVRLPNRADLNQIEYSNRFYEEEGVFNFCIDLIIRPLPVPESHILSIIITDALLITLRYTDIAFFKSDNVLHANFSFDTDHHHVFLYILQRILGINADVFEAIGIRTDAVNELLVGKITQVKRRTTQLNKALIEINYLRNFLSKAFHSLSNLDLLIGFYMESHQISDKTFLGDLGIIKTDLEVLLKHSDHVTRKLEFELGLALGLINIEQTQIIKIFTVLAMIFMPPTLIASLYGMNFHYMPELSLYYGYPICLIVMVISSLLPYRFFKMKGWI